MSNRKRGKTISIYIVDSNPKGVKICDIKNSIVKAIVIPRNMLKDLDGIKELDNPGVYFLIGDDDQSGKKKVYVGETEKIFNRLKKHNIEKEFWNKVICLTSIEKDDSLHKANIKFLESYIYNELQKAGKSIVENSTKPTQSSLSKSQEDFILDFYDDAKLLISTLGYSFLEEDLKDKKKIFECVGKKAVAYGEYSEDGMIVFAGSKVNIEERAGLHKRLKDLRGQLKNKGILIEKDGVLEFTNDYVFSSPSTAAAVVLGRSANGWTEWKKDKKTLDDIYRKNNS